MRWPLIAVVATMASGIVGAIAWVQIAQPAQWTAIDGGGMQMDEAAVSVEFGVTMTFGLIGLVIGFILGLVLGWRAPDAGLPTLAVVLLCAAASAVVAWRLGIWWGPENPSFVGGVQVGDLVPEQLSVTFAAAFVTWLVGALIGLVPGLGLNRYARAEATLAAGGLLMPRDVGQAGPDRGDQIGW